MASGWITRKARYAVYTRDGLTCCYCGKKCIRNHDYEYLKKQGKEVDRADVSSLDHIVSQKELAALVQMMQTSSANKAMLKTL